MKLNYNVTNRFVHIHSIQGRCGSYIGPESRVCARTDGPHCRWEENVAGIWQMWLASGECLPLWDLEKPWKNQGENPQYEGAQL